MASHVEYPGDVTALFLVRLRFEAGSTSPMRAEVRMAQDVTAGFDVSSTVTEVESVVTLLREWLRTRARAVPPTE